MTPPAQVPLPVPTSALTSRVRWAAAYVVSWTPLLLVFTVLIGNANRMPVGEAVVEAFQTTAVAALLGLVVVWVTRVWGLPGDRPGSLALRHAVGAVLYTAVWAFLVVQDIRGDDSWAQAWTVVRPWFGWQLFQGIIVYGAVAGVVLARTGTRRAREREQALQAADALRARAELAALRGRLDPHFLFNTLHTVSALVRRDPAAAEQGIERLADLLRYVLDHTAAGRDEVALEDELAFVDAYLTLEHMRLGDRLRVEREIDDEVGDVRIPSLSLQPLVENAIRHGLAPRPEGGTLRLRAVRVGAQVEVTVADDGQGADPAAAPAGYGLGLEALRRRLAARHGDRASLDVRTAPGAGFTVTLRLPA